MKEIRFSAPWSWMLIGLSLFATVIFLWVSTKLWHDARSAWIIGLIAASVVGAALFTVRGYSVTSDAILVHRLFWSTRLPREGLISATVDAEAFKGALRTCGNGGLYSFSGWFWSKKLGRFRAWVTDSKRAVVLRYTDRTAVVSPGDPEEFARVLNAQAQIIP